MEIKALDEAVQEITMVIAWAANKVAERTH
jgi:hypothetical protein